MQRAVSQGLPPLACLPKAINAVAEMNGLFWGNRQALGYFPQMSLLEQLISHYPFAHFILNVRDHQRWVKSVNSHNDLRSRLVSADLPGLPPGVGASDNELIEWVAAHHHRVQTLLHQRGAKLLTFDIEYHGQDELSSFLGRQVKWGRHN